MKKIIAGVVSLILSFAAMIGAIVLFLSHIDEGVSFNGPGEKELAVEKPGQYYLWNQYEGRLDGKSYSQSREFPPGALFSLKKPATDQTFPFTPDDSISTVIGGTERISIGYFKLAEPGNYSLTISDLPEERLFSWSPSLFDSFIPILPQFLIIILVMTTLFAGGIVLMIFGLIEKSKKSGSPPLT